MWRPILHKLPLARAPAKIIDGIMKVPVRCSTSSLYSITHSIFHELINIETYLIFVFPPSQTTNVNPTQRHLGAPRHSAQAPQAQRNNFLTRPSATPPPNPLTPMSRGGMYAKMAGVYVSPLLSPPLAPVLLPRPLTKPQVHALRRRRPYPDVLRNAGRR